jgi:hypothetical protein
MERPEITKTRTRTSISFFTLDSKVEDTVRGEIKKTFLSRPNHHQKEDFDDIIYTCVKELMVTASSSNIKKVFFIEAKIDENNKEIYDLAKKNVRKLMNENLHAYMRTKLQKYNQNVEVQIEDRKNGVIIMVQNPAGLYDEEELMIRETFRKAMQNDEADLALMYDGAIDQGNHTFGLLMIINLLKDLGINPAYFRMGVVKNNTIARIEIPLTQDYVGLRE